MANAFFNDTLSPFDGIDIGWGQDPNFPIGEYSVVPDAPTTAAPRQFTLSQTEEGNIALSAGVLMITNQVADTRGGHTSLWYQEEYLMGGLIQSEEVLVPTLATDLDGGENVKLVHGDTYDFWIELGVALPLSEPEEIWPRGATAGNLVVENFGTGIRFVGSRYIGEGGRGLIEDKSNETNVCYIFLGWAKVEGDVITFTQNTFGPLTVPEISYLTDLVSEDDGNLLEVSATDRGLIAADDHTHE
tara:strand:+ start:19 stop:753 length:735 start_codon:yes stop_codon:yes gene_type:complete